MALSTAFSTAASPIEQYEARYRAPVNREELAVHAAELPTVPRAYTAIMRLVRDNNCDFDQLVRAVGGDPAIGAAVLRVANSASFGRAGVVTQLSQACAVLGLANLKSLVLAKVAANLNPNPTRFDTMVRENSSATAVLLRAIAPRFPRLSADELFLGGLMHRLGQMVLLANAKSRALFCNSVLNLIQAEGVDFVTAEHRIFGFSHPLIGYELAEKWGLPERLRFMILHYAGAQVMGEDDLILMTDLIGFADRMAMYLRCGLPDGLEVNVGDVIGLGKALEVFDGDAEQQFVELAGRFTGLRQELGPIW